MSPTPEQLEGMHKAALQAVVEENAQKEKKREVLKKRLLELNKVLESVNDKCRDITGSENLKIDRIFAGYLLDSRDDIVSLHPIIYENLFCGGVSSERLLLMVGKSFRKPLEFRSESFSLHHEKFIGKDVAIRYLGSSVETYPIGSFLTMNGNTLAVLPMFGSLESTVPTGVVDRDNITKTHVSLEEEITLEEAMVVALANAAGIKATDEKSDDFPLLLEQLKKIETEKGK